ncbi:MAG: sigma-54-dependent Fis family transcriptional regulator [Myxococcales bacterium]|nr:sigma-54-dependent Fis family transcriptional regulator [Myxococcales bacterium]
MARKRSRVLVVDDEAAMREVLQARLERWGHEVAMASSVGEAARAMSRFDPDVVVSDLVLPDGTGLDLLRAHLRSNRRFVIVTAYGTVDTAVEAMKGGAAEFLTKPIDYGVLRQLLDDHDAALAEPEEEDDDDLLVGSVPAMREVKRQIAAVGPSMTSVMVVGESGTGKELVARAIHAASRRADGPFIAVNAAAVPASIAEGELLGYERGAFTGATQARAGLFEQASGGTLFLDEITEMSPELQPKLLRVLEERMVRRLGSEAEVPCDVRFIAATNRSPRRAVESGRLREDLYHRICVFRIDLPPLRNRSEDIPALARHLLTQLAKREGVPVPEIHPRAMRRLQHHRYPGNVRELRNLLERAMVLAHGDVIQRDDILIHDSGTHTPPVVTDGITLPSGVTAADAERILIVETLKRVGNNKAEAARRLGLDVKTIRNKLKLFET